MLVILGLFALALAVPAAASAASANVAALQVALRARGFYAGGVDGVAGPATVAAVQRLQRRRGLPADGIAGPRTRRALGRRGRPRLGSRPLTLDDRGWDVAALQFLLATHGFPSGTFDGGLAAYRRRPPALPGVGRAARRRRGRPGTLAAAAPGAAALAAALPRPVAAPIGDGFGPRGIGFHPGLDLVSPRGRPCAAAAAGCVEVAHRDPAATASSWSLRHGPG